MTAVGKRTIVGGTSLGHDLLRRRITLHGVTVEVVFPRILARTLGIVLDAYPPAPPDLEPQFCVRAERKPGDRRVWTISTGEQRRPAGPGVGIAARWTEWMVVSEALKRWTDFVHVHAAVVATERRSALLIGRSGSGKSTTSVGLALDGLRLYTDDVALIERATLRPVVVPRPVKLDGRSRRMLRSRGLRIPRGTWLDESIDRRVIPGFPPIEEPGPPLTAVLFFAEERAAEAVLRPLTSAEAAMRLIVQSASERFDERGPSDGAVALVNAVPAYELVPGPLDATIRAVRALLEQGDGAA